MFKAAFDVRLYNVILLGIGFLLVLASLGPFSSSMNVMVRSIDKEYDLQWNAFTSLCIIFVVLSFANFAVPSILTVISTKNCLTLFSFLTGVTLLTFLYPVPYALNGISVVLGFIVAVLYTAKSQFLIENSDPNTVNRNTGIFWMMMSFGSVFGSLYFYLAFTGVEEVHGGDRTQTYIVFIAMFFFATLIFLLTRSTATPGVLVEKKSSLFAFKRCLTILTSKKWFPFLIPFLFTGMQQSFLTNLYPNTVANTKLFGADSIKLIGVMNICWGLGEIAGGGLFAFFGKFIKHNQKKVYIFTFLLSLTTYLLVSLTHPNLSAITPTESLAIIESRVWISIVCGVLLGLTDCFFNSQLIVAVAAIYSDSVDLSGAYALHGMLQSMGTAFVFFYSNFSLTLYAHVGIMLGFSLLNMLSFCLVSSPQPEQAPLPK